MILKSVSVIKSHLRKKGSKVYGWVAITENDGATIQLHKGDFLELMNFWSDDDLKESRISLDENGDILIG